MRHLILFTTCLFLPLLPLRAQDQFLPAVHAQLDGIERQVRHIRQLEALSPSPLIFPSAAGLEAFLRGRFARFYPPERFQADLIFYRALDLAPSDLDLESLYFEFIQQWIGGFYDTDRAAMSIIAYAGDVQDGLLPIPYQVTYAHEYVHALQDQHFDLERIINHAEGGDNRDLRLAIHALIEGDANYVMGKFVGALLDHDPAAVERAYDEVADPALNPALPPVDYRRDSVSLSTRLWLCRGTDRRTRLGRRRPGLARKPAEHDRTDHSSATLSGGRRRAACGNAGTDRDYWR